MQQILTVTTPGEESLWATLLGTPVVHEERNIMSLTLLCELVFVLQCTQIEQC